MIYFKSRVFKLYLLLWYQSKYFFNFYLNKIFLIFLSNTKYFILPQIPAVIINLDERIDRLKKARKALNRVGITKINRFQAIKDSISKRGCSKSHLGVLKDFSESKEEFLLVCEDDIKFIGNIIRLNSVIREFIQDERAKILCIGNLTRKKIPNYTRNLDRAIDVQTASCYLIKKSVIQRLIENAEDSITQLTITNGRQGALDKNWKKIQLTNIFVVPRTRLLIQESSYSDIEKKRVRYLT